MKRLCIIAFTAAMALQLAAQDQLNKEIVIEREISPELRAASRINTYPSVILPNVKPSTLTFSDMTTSTPVTSMLTTLAPASMGDAVTLYNQKGYASIGYFPAFNLGASAGYRIINKPRTSLGLWMQYDGKAYNAWGLNDMPVESDDQSDNATPDKPKFERHSFTVGADFTKIFKRAGRLDIAADFTYHSLNRPWQQWGDSIYRATAFNAEAIWSARNHDMLYFVRGKFNHFGFNNYEQCLNNFNPEDYLALNPFMNQLADHKLSQNIFSVDGGISFFLTQKSSLAGLVALDLVNYNHYNKYYYENPFYPANPDAAKFLPQIMPGNGRTLALLTLAPSYRYHNEMFTANVGVKAQISFNAGKTFHIAPDISVSATPSNIFGAVLRVGGGEYINRLATLFEANPFMSPSVAYEFSHRPINAQLQLKFGPFKGVGFEVFGGYEKGNDWLMPTLIPGSNNLITFAPVNLSAWNYGVAADAKFASMFTIKAKYTRTPGSYSSASLANPDRAKHVVESSLEVRPMEPLTVTLGFNFRGTRAIYTFVDGTDTPERISLRNANSLNLGANYNINSMFSVYASLENILCNRAYEVWGYQRQGIKGLIGVAVKF